ncbi:MAG: CHAT domain-containing protein, partial [Anaerolineae bacterium]
MATKTYWDFDLLVESTEERYRARVLNSPAGQASAEFALPFSELELENFLLRVGRPRRGARRLESPEMAAARAFGGRLFGAVFAGDVRSCLRSSLDQARREGAGLRIRLRFGDPSGLADLPWEYLYDSALDRFLVLSVDSPLVRYLDMPARIEPLAVKPPIRILVMISCPRDHPPLAVDQEWAKLKTALADLERRGLVTLERLETATLAALQQRLRREEYHVFHFVGHGGFDEGAQDGVLILEDEQGLGRPVSGRYLGTLLHDEHTLRLAVLNACEGARASRTDPFAGVAQSLVQQGVPAVIAMQFEITDEAAITLAHEFYAALTDGYPVEAALTEGRRAVFAQDNDVEWGTPVLYLRAPDGYMFDLEKVDEEEQRLAQVAALYGQAQAAMRRERWTAAVEKLEAVLALDPGHAGAASRLRQAERQLKAELAPPRHAALLQPGPWLWMAVPLVLLLLALATGGGYWLVSSLLESTPTPTRPVPTLTASRTRTPTPTLAFMPSEPAATTAAPTPTTPVPTTPTPTPTMPPPTATTPPTPTKPPTPTP